MRISEISKDNLVSALKVVRFCIKVYDDKRYWTTDLDGFMSIITEWTLKKRDYVEDRFDCDDFAKTFKCYCIERYGINTVGLVRDFIKRHAYVLLVTSDSEIIIFEPQNGNWWMFCSRPKREYPCVLSIITF